MPTVAPSSLVICFPSNCLDSTRSTRLPIRLPRAESLDQQDGPLDRILPPPIPVPIPIQTSRSRSRRRRRRRKGRKGSPPSPLRRLDGAPAVAPQGPRTGDASPEVGAGGDEGDDVGLQHGDDVSVLAGDEEREGRGVDGGFVGADLGDSRQGLRHLGEGGGESWEETVRTFSHIRQFEWAREAAFW